MKKQRYAAISILAFILVTCGLATAGAEQPEQNKVDETPIEIVEAVNEANTQPEQEQEPEYRYIQGCPLSEQQQNDIFIVCENYNLSFEFVMAVIERESGFDPDCVGDNGDSVGLMQIQEKWHGELMEELGKSNLYSPLENVNVGCAILSSYFEENPDVYYVLMRYNGGEAYANKMIEAGEVSDYARDITETAIMYERQNGI